ncbi:aminoglycoside phosphotransferase family protein [Clostridium sp. C8-1-8]|uniref:aminoglycoside phosphotransferase family protein n=1 Tax=Clostridium sp. C8-1-8 TaxID=2698831 RepID=UPI001371156C|nr:aminoglycoside phosphotransferase family protein [Clostridium sp. C8-1-8]
MTQNNERLFEFKFLDSKDIYAIFSKYNSQLIVNNIVPIEEGMSTSNYMVKTNDKRYLLKVYPKNNDHSDVEISAYKYAHNIINVPEVLYLDKSKILVDYTYAIFQYIDGLSLREYISKNKGISEKLAYNIGKMLGGLHRKEYAHTALLDVDLGIKKQITQFKDQYKYFLNGIPGKHLNPKVKQALEYFINNYDHMISKIAEKNVFCHGDFIPSNILVDFNDNIWIIDFEYCFSSPFYYDIGKFFRSRDSYTEYIDDNVKIYFADGYNAMSLYKLPEDWYRLAKVADIAVMLALINREDIPVDWLSGIEEEIMMTINML